VRLLWLKVYAAPVEESAPDSDHDWTAADGAAAEGEPPAQSRVGDESRVASRPRTSWVAASSPRSVAPWDRATAVVEPVPEPTVPDLLAPTREAS
jgi:hypothetical protein